MSGPRAGPAAPVLVRVRFRVVVPRLVVAVVPARAHVHRSVGLRGHLVDEHRDDAEQRDRRQRGEAAGADPPGSLLDHSCSPVTWADGYLISSVVTRPEGKS
ncbi:hypothetical protein EBO15_29350 [Actinomadura harenae]|uniref:Uncharacterized protein n=1 Tax=Actinomadura harenae TaxID=2483351 RepID=A0A3M2LX80_9ACTN|nr:hypothetical protein EBO15_29350 [Actinomadura harenae]